MRPDDIVVGVLCFVAGFCTCALALALWLAVFEPWVRDRRTRLYLAHLERQYGRAQLMHQLEVTVATTDDYRAKYKAQDALISLKHSQQISREVWPVLHPPRNARKRNV